LRPAAAPDVPAITAFLNRHAERAMFPLSNLARYGFDGAADLSVRFWFAHGNGDVSDVLTLTTGGMALPLLPTGGAAARAAARAVAGREVIGIVGPRADVRLFAQAAGLAGAERSLDRDEPHFALDLAELAVPAGRGELQPLAAAPPGVIRAWMEDYQRAVLNAPAPEAAVRAGTAYRRHVADQSHMVLVDAGQPLAMTGFNARLPGIVQIGGVYTPPESRGRGHARRALALHLAQARAGGTRRATLFSASDMASRAYAAIGFRQIGDWSVVLFSDRQVVLA